LNNKTISAAGGKNIRLDIFISDQLTDLSRSQIQKMIRDGLVLVNGKESKTGLKLDGNETIQYSFPNRSPELNRITPEDIPLNILHEDEDMIAVNKSAGMVVHPGVGKRNHTLVNGLAFHFETLSDLNGILRPGIVHRLDEYTSGVILVAKTINPIRTWLLSLKIVQFKKNIWLLPGIIGKKQKGRLMLPSGACALTLHRM